VIFLLFLGIIATLQFGGKSALLPSKASFAISSLDLYFSTLQQLSQPNGNYLEGEIEIVTDPARIAQIQKIQESRLLQKGYTAEQAAEYSRIGIVSEDTYWIWLRDAVLFPKGVPGTYDRLLWKKPGGVAVLPLFPDGRIALVLNYRHATRSWELELPRGMPKPEETKEEAALRELKEETGLIASSVTYLGEMAPDTGVISSVVPIYLAKITAQDASQPDYSEAIANIVTLSKEELKQGLLQGFLEVPLKGKIPLRDGFLTFALYQAELRS
jgi:ADP-ribose diphosphatase